MIPDAVPLLLEAALRALAAAVVLWAAMRLLHVENVLAQKAAWGLVLAAALAMPLLMRAPLLPPWAAIRVPAPLWHRAAKAVPAQAATDTAMDATGLAAIHANAAPAAGQSRSAQLRMEAQTETTADGSETYSALVADAPKYDRSKYDSQYDAGPRTPAVALMASAPGAQVSMPAVRSRRDELVAYGWLGYLCVAAALLLRLLLGLCSSLRLWMQAEPIEIAPDLDLPGANPVRVSRRIQSPVNIGSGIVLPADYAGWDAEKLRVVLAHERSHVRQRDFYLQLAAGLYAAVTWFSPLGWWLKRRLSELGEAISDRAGMEAAASPSAYAQMLLEFAALPRPAYTTGVAMAHSSNLSERIERLLNDSSFRRAFTGGRRALLVLVPAVLIATAALVHVQAAQISAQASVRPAAVLVAAAPAQPAVQAQDLASNSAASQSASSGQSHPDDAQVNADAAPAAPPAPPAPQAAPADDAEPAPAAVPPVPPVPSVDVAIPAPPMPAIHVEVPMPPVPPVHIDDRYHYHFAYDYRDGDPYAVVGDPGSKTRFAGDWEGNRQADVDKARAMAHGHFLLFRHDDKTYMVDDPATVAQIEAMQKPMEDLGDQMRALGKQMRDAGEQAREAGRKAREQIANIPTPDVTKEMADLNAAVAELKDKQGGTITREQLGEIERKLGEVQRRLMTAQIKVDVNLDMSRFGEVQGKYGQQMGELGKQMGQMARENDQKIKLIIDESMKSGKAKPVN